MPAWMPTPAKAKTPLMGMEPPMTMSGLSWACAAVPRASPAASEIGRASVRASRARGEPCFMLPPGVVRKGPVRLGPEGPQMKETAHAPPDLGQALRLENQEKNDQGAEDDGAHRRDVAQ